VSDDDALRRLGDLRREIESRRGPDPYPRAAGPTPTLEEPCEGCDEITRVAARHDAPGVAVFGSVARDDAGTDSDLDILVEIGERRSLFVHTALHGDRVEELLGCPVHVVPTGRLKYAHQDAREQIQREVVSL